MTIQKTTTTGITRWDLISYDYQNNPYGYIPSYYLNQSPPGLGVIPAGLTLYVADVGNEIPVEESDVPEWLRILADE